MSVYSYRQDYRMPLNPRMKSHQLFQIIVACLAIGCTSAWGKELQLQGRGVTVDKITPLIDKAEPVYHVQRAEVVPIAGTDSAMWKKVPAMVLDRKEQSGGKWDGATDLSGSMRLLWDEQAIYFHVEVTDNIHSVPMSSNSWWKNDGLQFALDAYLNGPKGGYDTDEHNYFVCDSPKGPTMVCYFRPGQPLEAEAVLKEPTVKMSVRADGVRVYEWAQPWPMLDPVSPWLLGRCGFSWCLADNDGNDFKSSLFWTKGVIYGQDAAQFGRLVFDGAVGSRPGLLGLRPESKPRQQARDSQWLSVEGMDPWCAARLLVTSPKGGPIEAHATIYRQGEDTPFARGTIQFNATAGQTVGFSWGIGDLPGGWYEVAYDVPGIGQTRRMTFNHFNYDYLSAKEQALRTKFGIDRPWDAMSNAPALIRRHRGMVAAALQMLNGEDWSRAATHVHLKIDGRAAFWAALVDTEAMLKALDAGKDALAKRRGDFLWAYYSQADGCGHNFVVELPDGFDSAKTYPLVVWLHGAGSVPLPHHAVTDKPRGYIRIMPWGLGPRNGGYRALAEQDVLETIDFMKEAYRIDPDRIYLGGASMGGYGAWQVGTRYADRFAAVYPCCGAAYDAPLENLQNVALLNTHGDQDWTVPLDLSRYSVSVLMQWGYPVTHQEIAGGGHDAPISKLADLEKWCLSLNRPDRPTAVSLTCQSADDADSRAYWLAVRQMADPHRPARVHARTIGRGVPQALVLDLFNIDALELDTSAMPLDRKADLLMQIGFEQIQQKAPLPERLFAVRQGGHWTLTSTWMPPKAQVRPYSAGADGLLYRGEPLMIVYGTQGSPERVALLAKAAANLSGWAGAGDDMTQGHIPVKTDKNVTADDLQHFNLILLGGTNDNALTSEILPKLPLTITAGSELIAGDRDPVSLKGAGLRLAYYNPLAPQRQIFLIATDGSGKDADDWYSAPRRLMSGAGVQNRVDTPDLVVQTFDGLDRRRMQLTTGWQWRKVAGADVKFPEAIAHPQALVAARLRLMRRVAGADFSLGWSNQREEKEFDFSWFRLADFATDRTPEPTLLCTLSGGELKDLYEKWIAKGELAVFPPYPPEGTDLMRDYRVAMSPGLSGMLGSGRKKNLRDVKAGPAWRQEDLWEELLGEDAVRPLQSESQGY